MTHHRGLVITLVVAVVIAAVGIGAMALATNDSGQAVRDDVTAYGLGLRRAEKGKALPGPGSGKVTDSASGATVAHDPLNGHGDAPGSRSIVDAAPGATSETHRFVMSFLFDRIVYGMALDRARSRCVEDATSFPAIKVPTLEGFANYPAFVRFSRDGQCASQVAVAVFSVGTRNCNQGADLFLEQRPGGPVEARWQLIAGSRDEGTLEINDRVDPPMYTVDLC
jgi:hypothetical protein